MNAKGKYDIVEFLIDHCKAFKSLYCFDVGKLELQKTTELDCESLFSQAGHLSHTNCSRTTPDNFERLVMEKHRIDPVYCFLEKVKNEFIDQWKIRNWTIRKINMILDFWDHQKEEYLEHLSSHKGMFDFDDEEKEDTMTLWGKEETL